MAKVVVVDVGRCVACKQCEISCAVERGGAGSLVEAARREHPPRPRVRVVAAGDSAVPVRCAQCDEAPCAAVCPKDALSRPAPDGPVVLDVEACIGCGFCTFVCPYGAIELAPGEKKALKCDACFERTEAGGLPACVEACPTGALAFVADDDALRRRRRELAESVAARNASHADEQTGDSKQVACEVCGRDFAPRKLLARLRTQVPDGVSVPNVCPRCRRANAAEATAGQPAATTATE